MIQLEQALTRYLFYYRYLSIPSFGQIRLVSTPASLLFSEKKIYPPFARLEFSKEEQNNGHLNQWISEEFQISLEEAKGYLEAFISKFRAHIQSGAQVHWLCIGTFIRDERGEILLEPEQHQNVVLLEGIQAEKASRPESTHTIRVGEEERSNHEMEAILQKKQITVREFWWVAALVLLTIGIGSIWAIIQFLPESWIHFGNCTPFPVSEISSFYEWIH